MNLRLLPLLFKGFQMKFLHIHLLLKQMNELPKHITRLQMLVNDIPTLITRLQKLAHEIPEQVQNFPQLVIKFKIYFCFNLMVAGSNLSWQGIERKGSVH